MFLKISAGLWLLFQEYPANRVLLAQGEKTEYLFIIMKGKFTLPGTQLSIQLIV